MSIGDDHLHIPTPGELYSSRVGSAITTIIEALARENRQNGGQSSILVVEGREHEDQGSTLIEFPRPPRDWLTRREKALDIARSRSGGHRKHAEALYHHALQSVPGDYDGYIFLHNAPQAVRVVRETLPKAKPVLYAHNELFRTWGPGECRRLMSDVHRVIFVSEWLRKQFHRARDIAPTRTATVINGVDVTAFQPGPFRQDAKTVLFVGKVTPEKGAHLLVRAAMQLWEQGNDFQLRIVGSQGLSSDWPLSKFERGLRRLVDGRSDVEFSGFLDRQALPAAYAAADVFCVPSAWEEPCSLTLPEGLASGLPTISSTRGGLPEVGRDSVVYFTPPHVGDLAQQLKTLLADTSLRAQLARRARARGEQLAWQTRFREVAAVIDGDS